MCAPRKYLDAALVNGDEFDIIAPRNGRNPRKAGVAHDVKRAYRRRARRAGRLALRNGVAA